MQKRNIKYLLFISLAFNIAFIGGFTYHIINAPFRHPGFPPAEMKPPVKDFFFQKKEEMQKYGKDFMDSKKIFMESLLEDNFNEEISIELMNESVQKHMKMESEIGKSMIELRKKMSAEEAKRIFGQMQMNERRFERLPGRRRNNKF